MTHTTPISFRRYWPSILLITCLIFINSIASASHYRYGNISWQHISGNTYEITVKQAWRKSFPNFPNVVLNGLVNTGDLNLGDGQIVPLNLRVSFINVPDDWFYGEFVFTKTYAASPTPRNYNVTFTGCCRVDGLQNADVQDSYLTSTVINAGTTNSSPIITINPIINVQYQTINTFPVPTFDPDGDALTFRFATAAEMGAATYHVPAGASINPATGIVTFNTNGYPLATKFTIGVIASDGKTSAMSDFIVNIVPQSTPPRFDYAVTPVNTHIFKIAPGQLLTFPVKALDIDPGSTVTLSGIGLPAGSSVSPSLPLTGNPVTTNFSWTPTMSQFGTYVLNFVAQDNLSVQTSTSVTIVVSLAPVFNVPPTPAYGVDLATSPGFPFDITLQASDPDPLDKVSISAVSVPSGTSFIATGPGNPSAAAFHWNPAVSDWGFREVEFKATDSYGDFVTHKIGLIVNTRPVFTSVPVTSVVVNQPYEYIITGFDPDVPYGDELEVMSSTLPSWLTLTDNHDGTATLSGTPTIANAGTHPIRLYLEDIYHHSLPNAIPSQIFDITVLPCTIVKDTVLVSNVLCAGVADGSAKILYHGGFGPFTYQWSNGSSDSVLTNAGPGSYLVTVTDAYSCSITDSFIITEPALLDISATVSDYNGYGVSCTGSANGSITVLPSGGTAPYTFFWPSNGSSGSSLSGLPANVYAAFVKDANGCIDSVTVNITQPERLDATVQTSSIACFGGSDASASVLITGGVPSYQTLWSTGSTDLTLSGLSAGIYSVVVTDGNGCVDSVFVTITQPAALAVTADVTPVSCFGGANGAVSLTVSGGVPAYQTEWSNGATGTSVTGLAAGTYTVTVTDSNGCVLPYTVQITEPAALSVVSTVTPVSCFGGSDGEAALSITGGSPAYAIIWSTGLTDPVLTSLPAGFYKAWVTDAKGCTDSISVTIAQPAALAITAAVTPVSCFGGTNGAVALTISGGVPSYLTSWSNGLTGSTLSGLTAGTYTATVTDSNGCVLAYTVQISQPSALAAASTVTPVSCFGGANGAIALTISGGVPAYHTTWSNGLTGPVITGLSAGVYTATIVDSNACVLSYTAVIGQPAKVTASVSGLSNYSGYNVSCFAGSNGSATAVVAGGIAPYTYAWSNGAVTKTVNGLSAQTYSVTGTDTNGCTAIASVTLTQPSRLVEAITSPTVIGSYNTSCSLDGDGSATVTVSGGVSPYVISWNTGASTATIGNLLAGTYAATITDLNGCTVTKSISLTRPANCNCVITPAVAPVSCAGCTKVLDGQSNVVLNSGDNACIVNTFTGSINMNGGNLVICGNATVQWLTIPNNSKVTVLGILTLNGINFNGASAALENYGTIVVNGNLNVDGKLTNHKTILVKQTANLNSNSFVINNGTLNVTYDLNNNRYLANNGSLIVGGTVYNNSNSTMLNNCTTKATAYFVNSNVAFANNGTLTVKNDTRFNTATGTIASGSILTTRDIYLNGTNLSGAVSCALIKSSNYTQINQATLNGAISLCDANGFEIRNNLVLSSGANTSCTSCQYSGVPLPGLRDGDADAASVTEMNTVSIYPNPVVTGSEITISHATDIASVSILDNTGKEVIRTTTAVIGISNLSSGMYLVKVQDILGNVSVTKLVVQ